MESYDGLLDKAQALGLTVYEKIPLEEEQRGMILLRTIGLSDILETENEKRTVLAEEIAHFEYNTGDITQDPHAEWIAHKAMIESVGLVDMIEAIIENGEHANIYTVAQTLGIAEWFCEEVYKFYSDLPLRPFKYRGYIVSFHPLNVRVNEE